jgi:hypothetical protein
MPRGGRRQGKPGQAYPNRSDLPTAPDPGAGTFKGQPYGAATAQAQVQGAIPPSSGGSAPGQMAGPSGPAPGSFGAFNRPTERPKEPITAGLDIGPGPGSEVLGLSPKTDAVALQLRALYQRFPIPEIAELLMED